MPSANLRQLENSQVELAGEIPAAQFEEYYAPALKQLKEKTTLKGFRPGHVPDEILLAEVGNDKLLTAMAELALRTEYPQLLKHHRIEAIGRPNITIIKLARHNPLGYKIVTAVLPQFSLPDYKTIAAIINQTAQPAITVDQKNKRRLEIIEAIDKQVEMILPPLLIENELDRMIAELKSDLKTAEGLRTELRPQSVKQVRIGLILERIGEAEHLEPDPEKIKAETDRLLATHPDFNPETIKNYVISVLKSEVVWTWLESQK